jgi:peroxiredoxin
MDLIVFGVALPWLFVGLGCWLGYQLLRQNGRILLRLEALEKQLAQLSPAGTRPAPPPGAPEYASPRGLPLGSAAPPFTLPDLAGTATSLSEFLGRRLLLLFFNPRCGFCTRMAPDLAVLPADGDGDRPLPLVITTGDVEENRKLVAEHGIRCPVLLQEQMEVGSRYQCQGTPMGYLIDAEGRIASDVAVGADALLALATGDPRPASPESGHPVHKGNRDLADSKIQRNGLAPGVPAPGFAVPGLHGEEVSLEEFRGRKVVLVFSDPKCGPCDQLAPRLEQFHRRGGSVQVVMVSRGELQANQEKAEEHGLTFPIALQKQWEVSRAYAMFATPIAYLIDSGGVIVESVAVGADAILALLARAGSEPAATPEGRCRCGKPLGECGCARSNGRAEGGKAGAPVKGARRR